MEALSEKLHLFLVGEGAALSLELRQTLEAAGHQVSGCRTGVDALTVLGHAPFDLVLLDQTLPDLSSLDLLHALDGEGLGIPSLVVAARGDDRLARDVLRAGALDYLVLGGQPAVLADLPRVREALAHFRRQQLHRLLNEALESAGDGILVTDLQGTILHVNRALEHMTGFSRNELIGQPLHLIHSGQQGQGLFEDIWPTVLARGVWQGELTCQCKDGRKLEVALTVAPVRDEQKEMKHLVAIQRDLSGRKQRELEVAQAHKMQSVGTLAGGVAHQFNNLLAGISGYAALTLRETLLPGESRKFLEQIISLSERAARLTRQLLTYARQPVLRRQPLALAEVVRNAAEAACRTHDLTITLDLEDQGHDGQSLMVVADAGQLEQALVNLAGNARDALLHRQDKASSVGPVLAVTFRLRHVVLVEGLRAFPQTIPAGDYAVVEVVDQGCGMQREVLSRAIDPFFTTKDIGLGIGLGLTVVFGIVQGHQGFLAIESIAEQGTRVGLYLPRLAGTTSRESVETAHDTRHVVEPPGGAGYSILVIDDEEAVGDMIRRFLEIDGHRVHAVTNGNAALDYLSRGQPIDLVLLDLMMPGQNGETTYLELKQRWPDLEVIFCTGLATEEEIPSTLPPNAVILHKPFRMNELWFAVRQVLAGERGTRSPAS